MADQTIAAGESGVYEIALVAATPQEVVVNFRGTRHVVEVVHNSGAKPIYVGKATQAAKAKTSEAQVVPGGVAKLTLTQGDSLWIVSAAVGEYSVRKA